MRIETDRGICVGAGMCALTVPAVFAQDVEEGLVVVLRSAASARIADDRADAVREAAQLCPSGAITLSS